MNEKNLNVFIDLGTSNIRLGIFNRETSNNLFVLEKEFDAFTLNLAAPIDRGTIFISKVVSGTILLLIAEIMIIPPFVVFMNLSIPSNWPIMMLILIIGDLGIMSIGAIISGKFITATIFDCNIDTVIFNAWLCEDLLPKLPDNNVLVLDNASFHNKKFINTALQKHGHVALFLPPYSPELNSIERKWAQVKSIRRKERCNVHKLFQQYAS